MEGEEWEDWKGVGWMNWKNGREEEMGKKRNTEGFIGPLNSNRNAIPFKSDTQSAR